MTKAPVSPLDESEVYSAPSEVVNTAHNPNLTFKSITQPLKHELSSSDNEEAVSSEVEI